MIKNEENLFKIYRNNNNLINFKNIEEKYFPESPKCRICNDSIYWSNVAVRTSVTGNYYLDGRSYQNYREYNGIRYNLSVCERCFFEKFPERKEKNKLPFNGCNHYLEWAYNIPNEVYKEQSKKRNSRTKKSFIGKHGPEEGQKRWDAYCQKQSITNTFEYKQEKYGWTEEEFKEYNNSRAVTLNNCIKRHGIKEGTKIFKDYCKRQAYAGNTLEYFIKKLGEKEGNLKYAEICKAKLSNFGGFSKISQKIFTKLDKLLEKYNLTTFYKNKNREFSITFDKTYFIDYYIDELKLAIEFNGDYWHANPLFYKPGTQIIFPGNVNILVDSIWIRDKKREEDLSKNGYTMITVWESEGIENSVEYLFNIIEEKLKNASRI